MAWIPGWDSVASAHSWSNFYFGAGIVALILLGVFEVISHRYSERKDELAAIEQTDTQRRHDEEMARLHADTEASKSETAKALAQAAEANRIAEGERLARVKLEAQLASRHLTDDQKSTLTGALAKLQSLPKAVAVARLGDHEANEYATEIIRCIDAAGIYPGITDIGIQTPPRYGLKITPDLKPAFDEAGIKVDEILPQDLYATTIFVGLKPPTL